MKERKERLVSQRKYVKSKGVICPHCKKTNISADSPEIDGDIVWVNVSCANCEATWTDIYELTGYDNLETPIEEK